MALLTAEAEYVALDSYYAQILWMQWQQSDFGEDSSCTTIK